MTELETIHDYYTEKARCCFCAEDSAYAHRAIRKAFNLGKKQSRQETLNEVEGKLPFEQLHELPDQVRSPHETDEDRGWNKAVRKFKQILTEMKE